MTTRGSFLPSQVMLSSSPLVGTMDNSEREFAAALLVRACQVLGDAWKPVELRDLGQVMKSDVDQGHEPLTSFKANSFFNPNFDLFADGVYGRWLGVPRESALEFTERGIEALRRWVTP
jgi:hypothetical protein